jgi:hypothetical protein
MRPTHPLFTGMPTTIFEVMSRLAIEHKAVNLGQGFPMSMDQGRFAKPLLTRSWRAPINTRL